jgi:hypothetical protein
MPFRLGKPHVLVLRGASSLTRTSVGVCFLRLVLTDQAFLGPAMAEHNLLIEREALSGLLPWRGFLHCGVRCYSLIEAPACIACSRRASGERSPWRVAPLRGFVFYGLQLGRVLINRQPKC